MEMACKKLKKALEDELQVRTFLDREGGQLLSRWDPLARVRVAPMAQPTVEWNTEALGDIGVPKASLVQLAERTFSKRAIQWSG